MSLERDPRASCSYSTKAKKATSRQVGEVETWSHQHPLPIPTQVSRPTVWRELTNT